MREVCNGLHHLLELRAAQFIQHKRQNDGHRETEDQLIQTDQNRIGDCSAKERASEEGEEMLKSIVSGKRASPDPQCRLKILERQNNAAHRIIMKYQIEYNNR